MPPGSRAESEELNMKQIKVEWCENFIKATFKKHVPDGGGIYTGCFWDMAEKIGTLGAWNLRDANERSP